MDFWVCLMVKKSLPSDDASVSKELSSIFGKDFLDYEVVCTEQMLTSGEYYVFARCASYHDHEDSISSSHHVSAVIPSISSPHRFSKREISEFSKSAGVERTQDDISEGDVVLVKSGYLKGLYGIVRGKSSGKKFNIFFSFYTRSFVESIGLKSLEFIGKASGYNLSSTGNPVVLGAHIVHSGKIHRSTG